MGLITAKVERKFLKPESQCPRRTEISMRINRRKENDQKNWVCQSFWVGPSLRQMANEATSRETANPAFLLASWGTRPRRKRRTCQELCKRSWQNRRVGSMGDGGHGEPRPAHGLRVLPTVRLLFLQTWLILLHSCNGHLKYYFQSIF